MAISLSFILAIVSVSAETLSLSPYVYSFQVKQSNGNFSNLIYGSDPSSLSYGTPGGYAVSFNNTGGITDLYLGNSFSNIQVNGTSSTPFLKNYSYHFTYVITAAYDSSSSSTLFHWNNCEVNSFLCPYLDMSSNNGAPLIGLSSYEYVGLLTDVYSYTDTSFAPASYRVDYTFEIVFHLPSNYTTSSYNYFYSQFHFPSPDFTSSTSVYMFLKSNTLTATYDPTGSDLSANADAIIDNALEIGSIAHDDAVALQNSISGLESSLVDELGGIAGLIEGDGSFGSPESDIIQGFNDYDAAESELLDQVGIDSYLSEDYVDNMFSELEWDNIDVPDRSSASIFHSTVNPIFEYFPVFIVFPCFLGLVATILGRRRT